MMRLAGMSHTSRSAAVLEINTCFSKNPEAKDSDTFQIFWGLQEAPAVLTFFDLTALASGSYLKCFMLYES